MRWLIVAVMAVACARGDDRPAPAPAPKVKAHRGASHDAPENTVAAVTLAWEQGAAGAEIDVRMSKDGVPVVIHDEDTARTAGVEAAVADQTAAALTALDVGAWKGAAFAGERLPTLADVLAAVPKGRTVFVEIKSGADTVPDIAAVIRASAPAGNVAFESFDLPVLAAVGREFPDAARYWLVGVRTDRQTGRKLPHEREVAEVAKAAGVTGVAVDHRGVDPGFRDAVAGVGLVLSVWTVDDPEVARRMRDLGVAWIETNRPGVIAAALE